MPEARSIADLSEEYTQASLNEADIAKEPLTQLGGC